MKVNWKNRLLALAVVPLLMATVAGAPSMMASAGSAPASNPNSLQNIPVTGTDGSGDTFTGTMSIVSFAQDGTAITATGLVSGVLKDASGNIIGTATNVLKSGIPVSFGSAGPGAAPAATTCNILHLVLGPLDLNLLGLTVHLNQVVLDITAHGGPGNLLGNLLCAIANLLNTPPSPLAQITDLLNRIIDLLG